MKKYFSLFITLVGLTISINSAKADDEKSPFQLDTSLSVFSDYMFRGFNLYPGSSIQPSITGKYDTGVGELSANLWMHLSGEGGGRGKPTPFTELDETLRYSYSTEDIAFTTGFAWYTYPDSSDDISATGEVFASIALNTTLNPILSVYHDYDEFDAQYYELGFSHSFEKFCGDATFTPFAAFGFATNAEKEYKDNGFVQATTGASLAIPVGDLEIVPNINYTFSGDDLTVNQFWFGTTINY